MSFETISTLKPQYIRLRYPPNTALSPEERFKAVQEGLGRKAHAVYIFRKGAPNGVDHNPDYFYHCAICASDVEEQNACDFISLCPCKMLLHAKCMMDYAKFKGMSPGAPKCIQCGGVFRWVHGGWVLTSADIAAIKAERARKRKEKRKTIQRCREKNNKRRAIQRAKKRAAAVA